MPRPCVATACFGAQVIASHDHFLTAALDGLLLSHPKLLQPLLALQRGALLFAARVNTAWDAIDKQYQQQQQAAQQQLLQQRASGSGASSQRPPTPSKAGLAGRTSAPGGGGGAGDAGLGIARRREARLDAWSQSGATAATAQLDVDALAADLSKGYVTGGAVGWGAPTHGALESFARINGICVVVGVLLRLSELLEGLQGLYSSVMRREGSREGAPQVRRSSCGGVVPGLPAGALVLWIV